MGNDECRNFSEKIQKFQLFLTKTSRENLLAKTITACRSTEGRLTDSCKNISISKLPVKAGLKNIPFNLQKIRKLNFFPYDSPKKNYRRPKVWNIDCDPILVFMQKSEESNQWVVRKKLHLNR